MPEPQSDSRAGGGGSAFVEDPSPARVSARADTGEPLDVDQCIVSARADSRAAAADDLRFATARLHDADRQRIAAMAEQDAAIYAAGRAGIGVREIARLAGMGKTQASEIARFGQRGWR